MESSDSRRLLDVLDALLALLKADGEQYWVTHIETCRQSLLAGDRVGLKRFLRTYGGMASFSDLVIGQTFEDGVFAWKPDYRENNTRLELLRAEARELAEKLLSRMAASKTPSR